MAIAQDAWQETEQGSVAPPAPVIGRLCGAGRDGAPLVAWDGGGPVPARPVARLDPADLCRPEGAGREVLLLFPEGGRPVIVDLLADPVADVLAETLAAPEGPAPEARLDGARVVLEGRREVVLRCGQASITLRRDGKVIVRGTELLSRATGRNRIKGASVAIN